MQKSLAVVIPIYNEALILNNSLSSFSHESNDHILFVIVDNQSTDGSVEIVREWQQKNKHINLVLLSEPKKGSYFARLKGLFYAKDSAAIVISTDIDNTIGTGFFDQVFKTFDSAEIQVLQGRVRYDPYVRLLKQLYLPKLMKLIALQEKVECYVFGDVFFGGYFGILSNCINDEIFKAILPPKLDESSIYISRRCGYFGYSFGQSPPNMRTSNRRFWDDPLGSIEGQRFSDIRMHPSKISKQDKLKLIRTAAEHELELITARKNSFAKRMLFLLYDSIQYISYSQSKNRALAAIKKAEKILELHDCVRTAETINNPAEFVQNYLNQNFQNILHSYVLAADKKKQPKSNYEM